ncbi:MAG: dephospho-CoA kinase [Thermincolia bacterium]
MHVIGLTGGIACGKSTVSRMLRQLGARIFDADVIAKEIVKPGQPALEEIREAFGQEIILPDGELNRKKLGLMVFGNPAKLAILNGITHPRVKEKITAGLEELKAVALADKVVAVVDAPLLIEAGLTDMVEEVWLVVVNEEIQVDRLVARDGITIEQARKKLASQMSLKAKLPYADKVIDNNGPIEETYSQVLILWEELNQRA